MTEKLRYVDPKTTFRDQVDRLINHELRKTAGNLEVTGLENIPRNGPFVLGVIPHSGILEAFVVSHLIGEIRTPPVWATKIENQELPSVLIGNRSYFFLDRDNTGPSFLRNSLQILKNPDGIVASAWEGTRFGRKEEDPDDLLTLAPVKHGLLLVATRAGVPLITAVILGTDQVLARLDLIKKEAGTMGVLSAFLRSRFAKNKPPLSIDFSPPYKDHITGERLRGQELDQHLKKHAEMIMRQFVVPAILKHNPGYPLGPYSS